MSYKIDKTFALVGNEGSSSKANGKIIILHETANPNASAYNNASFEKRTWNSAYVHFIAGDGIVYQVGAPGYDAWGAGSQANDVAPVQIEMENTTDKVKGLRIYKTYIELARDMAKKYDTGFSLDAGTSVSTPGFKSHKWVSDHLWGDHQDPYAYLATLGISKAQLAKDLKNGIKEDKVDKVDTYWNRKGNHYNLYELTSDLNVYNDNKLKEKRRVKLGKGSRVYVTDIYRTGKAKNITRLKVANGWISGNTKFMKRIKY